MNIVKTREVCVTTYNLLSDNNFLYRITKTIDKQNSTLVTSIVFFVSYNNTELGAIQSEFIEGSTEKNIQYLLNDNCSEQEEQLIVDDFITISKYSFLGLI